MTSRMKLLFKLFIRLMQILLEHTTASIYSEMCMCVCVGYVCVCQVYNNLHVRMYVCWLSARRNHDYPLTQACM